MGQTVALFGEAQRGAFQTAYFCHTLPQLLDTFGEPPEGSQGLTCAVQFIMNQYRVIYFRVKEEGFSYQEYYDGLNFLHQYTGIQDLTALCLPGVGSQEVLEACLPISYRYQSPIVINEADLYDLMTH